MRYLLKKLLASTLGFTLAASLLAMVPVILSAESSFAGVLDTLTFPRNKVASIFDSQGRAPLDCYQNSGTCGGTKTATNEQSLPAGGYFRLSAAADLTYRSMFGICDAAGSCQSWTRANIYAYKPGEYFLLRVTNTFPTKDWLLVFSLGNADPYLANNGSTISWSFDSAILGQGIYNAPPTVVSASVTGTFRVGETLTGTESYSGVDVEIRRQWKLSDYYRTQNNVGGTDIPNATTNTYTLTNSDYGKWIRYVVKARNMQNQYSDVSYGAKSDYAIVLAALLPALTPALGTYTSTATGFTVAITNYNTAYTWEGTATKGGSVSFSGTNGNGLATITGVSPNTASVATITTTRTDYNSGSAATASTKSLNPALTPTFETYTRTADGFTVRILNYDTSYTWGGTATNGGSVSFSGTTNKGLATITGLAANTASVATITTTRSTYATGSANTSSTTSLAAALNPMYGTYTQTSTGYTVQISNYSNQFTWSGRAVNGATVAISNTGLVTISNLSPGYATCFSASSGLFSYATIETSRSGYVSGSSSTTSTSALRAALTPTLGVYTRTADGFTVTITNYNPAFTWSGSATRSGSVSFSGTCNDGGLATITGVAANTASVATITTTLSGYTSGNVVSDSTNSLAAALTPTVSSVTPTFRGFTFNVTNYSSNYTFSLSTTSGSATAGTPSGSSLPVTVSGLSSGASATVSITTTRSGYADGHGSRGGTAKTSALTPTSGTPGKWNSSAISDNGQYVVFAGTNSNLFVSPNNGADWDAVSSTKAWTSVATSSTGQKMLAGAMNSKLYLSTNYGATWSSKAVSKNWRAVAMSADGNTLYGAVVSGFIFKSVNGGSSWSQVASLQNWRALATSQSGQAVIAAAYGGTLYVSTDSGSTWTSRESARNWSSVSISDTGTVMVATVVGGGAYLSSDSGVTWSAIAGVESKTWNSVSCNSTCSQFAISSVSGNLYLLSNLGEKIADASNNLSKWSTVTLNSAGTQIIAGAQSGALRRSVDSGSTWSLRTRIAS